MFFLVMWLTVVVGAGLVMLLGAAIEYGKTTKKGR